MEKIIAENIKCRGCVDNITEALTKIDGLTDIHVDLPTGTVSFTNSSTHNRKYFTELLKDLGYPEKGKKRKFKIW